MLAGPRPRSNPAVHCTRGGYPGPPSLGDSLRPQGLLDTSERFQGFGNQKVGRAPFIAGDAPFGGAPARGWLAAGTAVEEHVEPRARAECLAQRVVQILMAALNDDAEGAHGVRSIGACGGSVQGRPLEVESADRNKEVP